ncbi:MAG TPA: ATP-grasp domain-containing protein [Gemmatimonadales bacterium]|nr:ATP-grasp domain-containing protein [Gemmatimonadales bacterium]
MRVFVYEFVTGGGMHSLPLPAGLVREADLMVRALISDLLLLPDIQVVTCRDTRLPPIAGCEPAPSNSFAGGVEVAEAVWPIAPESGGTLESLVRHTLAAGRILLGCRPDAVRLTSSKSATAALLRGAGIPVVPTWRSVPESPPASGPWVVKPDDGAGCEDTWLETDWSAVRLRLGSDPSRLVAQPWIEGTALSLSLLCGEGRAATLAINRQQIEVRERRLELAGLEVNAVADATGRFAALGRALARALPSLWGYVGVDLVETSDGLVVMEINPRLTTAYCGLRRALGVNVAAMVLSLLTSMPVPSLPVAGSGHAVPIGLGAP